VFDFRVIAAFRPRESWVKAAVLNDAVLRRSTLGHEQTHFDLAEVHARRMRGYFDGLADACRKSDRELTALARRLIEEEKAEQQRYDAETDHGIRSDRQAGWTDDVARRLGRGR
jgi:predicted secreted Zn-dependent protease